MSTTTKLILSCVGVFFGGTGVYWQTHSTDAFNARLWIGLIMAGVIPLGSYLIGLAQKAPWDGAAGGVSVPPAAKVGALVGLTLLLGACASTTQPSGLDQALAKLSADVIVDLDAAQAIAVANNDELAIACYPALRAWLVTSLGTSTPSLGQVKGVISGYEKARTLRRGLEGGVGGIPTPVKLACAALLQDERLFALRLAAMIGGASVGAPGIGALLPK